MEALGDLAQDEQTLGQHQEHDPPPLQAQHRHQHGQNQDQLQPQPQQKQPMQQPHFGPSTGYEASPLIVPPSIQPAAHPHYHASHHHHQASHLQPYQAYPSLPPPPPPPPPSSSSSHPPQQHAQPYQESQHYHQHQQSLYNPQQQQQQQQQQQMTAYNLKAPSAMTFGAASVSIEERATNLLAACESCLVVTRIPGVDMSFRRIMERKCSRCGGTLVLPQEVMEMLILYGSFVPESVVVTLVLGTMVLHPSLRPDFMVAAMNELLSPLQTDFVYDVAVPKRPEGLGMSLRMNQGNLVVGGFIDFENNSESPSVAARIIAVNDVLVAINKKYITSWSFEKSISMLAHAASPVYLTFRRRQAVMLL